MSEEISKIRGTMYSNLKKVTVILCCLATNALFAQSQYDVVVKSAFSPVIQDAQKKINFPAKITDTIQNSQKVEYDVLVRPLQPDFKPESITAPKVGKDQIDRLYHHYLKAGVGYLQPLLEYDFASLRSKREAYGVHLLTHSSFDQVKYSGPSSFSLLVSSWSNSWVMKSLSSFSNSSSSKRSFSFFCI